MKAETVSALKSKVRGSVILPGDPGYEEARKVHNGMINKHPAIIIKCADVVDVRLALALAREQNLTVAIRGGGHNGAGLGTCDSGMVIDLSNMKGIYFDPFASTIRAEAGCTHADVTHVAQEFGVAFPGGIIGSTGIAGLTLGGGHGYLTRKYGLTIDNLLEVGIVLADGKFLTANAKQNSELFWAVRGGGGNFGVVTSFLFRTCPVENVVGGPMLWDLADAVEILKWYREFILSAPEELYGFFAFLKVPPGDPFPAHLHGRTVCGIVWCYTGSPENAEAVLNTVRQFRKPILELVGPMPYSAIQTMFDVLYPPGLQQYWKGHFLDQLTDEAIGIHLKHGSLVPTILSTMHIYPIDGAVGRVARDETAFSYRDAKWSLVIFGADPSPENADLITNWAKEYWTALKPYSLGGAYVNFMMDEGADRVKATYRDNYPRLVEIKTKYDPSNIFNQNQNISPARSATEAVRDG
jgi:FAD/FMN-containing dehydrogenase